MKGKAGSKDGVCDVFAGGNLGIVPKDAVFEDGPISHGRPRTDDVPPDERDISPDPGRGVNPQVWIVKMVAGLTGHQIPIRLAVGFRGPRVLQIAPEQRPTQWQTFCQQQRKNIPAKVGRDVVGNRVHQSLSRSGSLL